MEKRFFYGTIGLIVLLLLLLLCGVDKIGLFGFLAGSRF